MHTLSRAAVSIAVAASLLALAVASGDGGGSSSSSGSAPAADGFTAVKKLPGYQIKVPDGAKANRGAAGFHTDDKSFSLMLKEVAAPKTMDAAKASAQEFLFEKWIGEETLEDGWVLTWESVSMDMDGNKKPAFAFEVVRTLDGTQVKCSGSLPAEAGLNAVIESCKSLRKG